MAKSSRLLLGLAALSLLLVFAFPLWSISLEAPQYPEGLGMRIWVNTITGKGPHDLGNINNLNHYIGMKTIEPDAIRELVIMPWIVGFLVVTGLAAAAVGRRWMLFAWFGLLAALALAGMVDFWLWEYDYGHDLNPQAAIKIPGMSYQPPLIGSKTILNFKAHSWPALGGWVAFAAGFMAALAVFFELRRGRQGREDGPGPASGAPLVVALVASAFAAACSPSGPVPVKIGEDQCSHCLMTIADARYASELITRTGKVHTFDSVECLAAFFLEQDPEEVASMWVTDFHAPSRMVAVEEAFFLRSKDLKSPMGMDLTAFGDGIEPTTVLNSFMGEILDWEGVLEVIRTEGPPGHGMGGMRHGGHGTEVR